MNLLLTLSRYDLRSTFRDPIFKGLLLFPFVSFALVRWGLPLLVIRYPVMEPYRLVVLMWACMQAAIMFGFIYGFLFLEEKEEHIRQVIRVMPVSGSRLLAARLLTGVTISAAVAFVLLHWGGVARLPFYAEVLLSLQFSLVAPLLALSLGAFAANKIEGLAQMKIFNLLLILPGLIYFLPFRLLHLLALIPTYWSFRTLEHANHPGPFFTYFAAGSLVYMTFLFVLNRRMEKGPEL
jgi:ABC-type multidrug transport system permease subunit